MSELRIAKQKQNRLNPVRIIKNIIDPKTNWRGQSRNMVINKEVSNFTRTFRDSFVTFIVSALGLVAALSWNDAIKSAIERLFPSGADIIYKFYVAIMVTVIAVAITYFLSKAKKN
jgi:uncharacterized membrane protein YidH (DUF202 family)